jgi:hypothetical protein
MRYQIEEFLICLAWTTSLYIASVALANALGAR